MENLMTIAAVASELGIAYPTAHRWIAVKKAMPSEIIGKAVYVVRRSDFDVFAADYKAGRYDRWPK
jgi:hypothetical protein